LSEERYAKPAQPGLSVALEVPVFRALAGRFSSITSYTLPTKVTAGQEIPFAVAGHLDSVPSPDWPNFAVGFAYIEGPMAEIAITMDGQSFTLKPGMAVAKYMEPRPGTCTTISLDCKIKSLDKGSYKFAALTGYVDIAKGTFYYDDRVDRTLESEEVAWPWWLLPLAGGIGVVAVIGGVVYYEETRRQEMMKLLAR
jgi:hypothetical protein